MTDTDIIDDARPARDDVLKPGAMIDDRYEVLDVLGHGGCAVVYRVFDRTLRQELALKRLRPDRSASDQSMRLRREVRYAREVRSEHLVRIYDVSPDQDQPYITMELVEGETLAERLRRDGALPVEEALRVSREVLLALQALHDHGIVHRDVKPGNVLLTHRGDVRLGDLGLARTLAGDESAMTNPDSVVGTWQYISPEQALGATIVPESDLYSFGIVLYEMLTGHLPFDCDSSVGFLTAHLTQPPKRLRAERADVPRWLDRIVARLLEKQPQHRYRSASAVLDNLAARRATPAPRFTRILTATTLILLLLASAVTGYTWWASRFDRLVNTGDGHIAALDRRGRTLWTREDIGLAAPFRSLGRTQVAAFENEFLRSTAENRMRLSILDPQTGVRSTTVALRSGAPSFKGIPDQFGANTLKVVDIDHDGNDEVVVDYNHDYWPSYSTVWEPATGTRTVVLVASGHHRLFGTADVNGNGTDELLYVGINNLMGWNRGIAAVSPGTAAVAYSEEVRGSTPDEDRTSWLRQGIVWYALVGHEADILPLPTVDEDRRLILVSRGNRSPLELDFDGFARSWESDLPAATRSAARTESYDNLREANRSMAAGQLSEAANQFSQAITLADSAGTPILENWARTVRIRHLIATGQSALAESEIAVLTDAEHIQPSDVHWEAARAYHLEGQLREAVEHYLSGMARRTLDRNRFTREFVIGGVLALVELDEFQEARAFVRAYERSESHIEADVIYLDHFINWISGEPFTPLPDPAPILYEYEYWHLELQRHSSDPAKLLESVEALLLKSDGLEPMLLSLKADLLHQIGQLEEARTASIASVNRMKAEIDHSVVARAHRELIESRYEKIVRGPLSDQE